MKIRKILALAFALTVSGAMLTACGDDNSSSKSSTSSAASSAAESSSAEASSAEASSADDASSTADASSEDASAADASSDEASSEEPKVEIDRTGHNTFLMLADGSWTYYNMNDDANNRPLPEGGTTCEVNADGTYTVDVNMPDVVEWMNSAENVTEPAVYGDPAFGITVLNVDIAGLAEKLGVDTQKGNSDAWEAFCDGKGIKSKKATAVDKMEFARTSGFDVTELKLSADGQEVYTYAPEEILFGDIEGNGKIRIEIFNQYGDSKDIAPQAIKDYAGEGEYEKLEVTFTVKGIPA